MSKFPDLSKTSETAKVSFFESLLAEPSEKSFEAFVDALIINELQVGRCSFDSRLRLIKKIDDFFLGLPDLKISTIFLTGFSDRILDCDPPKAWSSEGKEQSLFELSRLAVIDKQTISCTKKLESIRLEFVHSMHRHDFEPASRCMLVLAKWDHDEAVRHATKQAFNQLSAYSSSLRFTDIDIELGYFSYVTQ